MVIVVLGKLIGLPQLVYWLKPIKSYELYLLMSSYWAIILHQAQVRDPRRMFYNMSYWSWFAVAGRESISHLQISC